MYTYFTIKMHNFNCIHAIFLAIILTRIGVDTDDVTKLLNIPKGYNFFEIPFSPGIYIFQKFISFDC